jgi:hypothetical protein
VAELPRGELAYRSLAYRFLVHDRVGLDGCWSALLETLLTSPRGMQSDEAGHSEPKTRGDSLRSDAVTRV